MINFRKKIVNQKIYGSHTLYTFVDGSHCLYWRDNDYFYTDQNHLKHKNDGPADNCNNSYLYWWHGENLTQTQGIKNRQQFRRWKKLRAFQ